MEETSSPSRQISCPKLASLAELEMFASPSKLGQVLFRSAHRLAPTKSACIVVCLITFHVIPASGIVLAADTIGCSPRHTASHADSTAGCAPQTLCVRPQQ